jgi:hypothetical protein
MATTERRSIPLIRMFTTVLGYTSLVSLRFFIIQKARSTVLAKAPIAPRLAGIREG